MSTGQLARNFLYRFRYVLLAILIISIGTAATWRLVQERRGAEADRVLREAREAAAESAAREERSETRRQDEALVRSKEAERLRTERDEQQKRDSIAASQAALEARRTFIARYLRTAPSIKRPGRPALAVAVMGSGRTLDHSLGEKIAGIFDARGFGVSATLFKAAFATDGSLERILNSDRDEIARLDLQAAVDFVLLGTYESTSATNPGLENVLTSVLRFSGGLIEVSTGALVESLSVESNGSGFSASQAELMAKERLVGVLAGRRWSLAPRVQIAAFGLSTGHKRGRF